MPQQCHNINLTSSRLTKLGDATKMQRATSMNKKQLPFLVILCLMGLNFMQACKDDDTTDDPTPEPQEFVADSTSFTSYASWSLDAELMGEDPALGAAHAGNDSNSVRKVYFMDGQAPVNGEYPIGTIIVKETSNDTAFLANTAMVKRGAGFNSANDGWEWFLLDQNGAILNRGADLMGGACAGCHSKASVDWVFTKN